MVNELLDNLEELIDKYIKSGLTLCAYLESQNLTVIYNNMLQVIKRRVKLKTKERFDGLMAKINIQEKRVHRKVVKCLIKDKLENPNYTVVDYYRKYGYLRCSTKMLRMSLFNKIDENDAIKDRIDKLFVKV